MSSGHFWCDKWTALSGPLSGSRQRTETVQGYLAHKKQHPPGALKSDYTWGHMVVLGGGAVSYERGTPVLGGHGNAQRRRFGIKHGLLLHRHGLSVRASGSLNRIFIAYRFYIVFCKVF